MDLSIIIVSYNTVDLIESCLGSLFTDAVEKEVFVVDNASNDGTADVVRTCFPGVHLIENPENRGFSAANNQVLSQCRGRYLVFLNPDTQLGADTLRTAVSFMDDHPRIGLAGMKIINPDGTLQESVSYRYPGEKYTRGELSGLSGQIACVLGAGMMARREIIQEVDGFDEDFFLYGEDQDLCLRIRKRGYDIGYIEKAEVTHLGGQSERQFTSAEKWGKKVRAEYLFYRKHYLPETITRIRRSHLLQAQWRIATLKLTIPFCKDKANMKAKLIKYQVIQDEICKMENSIEQKK
ncbi:MAG: glycosyltransferase family 2 protein [Deltaproteobacteria bacterium HGW-Deltaproteobacteria-9]|nr:MAG: glycosyltransferase family 2 protein [Deltaproteobacteria bacterium HGW-Deltaproteobacteria-9]